MHIVLDSFPLGALAHPNPGTEASVIQQRAISCFKARHDLYIPEVIDYELRRELLRTNRTRSINKLDNLASFCRYVPLTTRAMRLAAELWAQSRRAGQPTGDPNKLDADSILASQALTLGFAESELVIATSNVRHLSQFVPAQEWNNIRI